jgi:purine nucleosidase/pyrimidine-specific ribonucleoside hydrolase
MAAAKQKIIFDTDIGDDIDDAWALATCIRHPELELVGVTTVWRDTELRAAQARFLLELAGTPRVPVAAGARDALDKINAIARNRQADVLSAEDEERLRKGRTDGVRFLAEMAREHEGLTLIPVGPETNIARFIMEFPEQFSLIGRLVIMGGHRMANRDTAEYNAGADPRATKVVFGCRKPITMVGLDVTLQCRMRPSELEQIRAKDTPLSRAILRMTELWQEAHRRGEAEEPRMPVVHDPLAVLVAADPSLVECEAQRIEIDEQGRCVRKPGQPNVAVAVDVDEDRVRRKLVELIG